MLHRLGRSASKPASDEPAEMVLACHGRIRELTGVALALARTPDAPPADVAAAATRLHRYFTEALPLHEADEESTIGPALRALDPSLATVLDAMEREHAEVHATLAELLPLWETAARAPEAIAEIGARLTVPSRRLAAAFDAHLALEEREIVPRLAEIASPERRAMGRAMRDRRG